VRRVVVSELMHRRGRAVGLLLGIVLATTSFTVLTATSRTQRLEVRGTVARSFRGSYDVLVRPRGARTALERRTGQVLPDYLSGLPGGITFAQWRRIARLPGVEVAAPIANVGYLLPTAQVSVDVSPAAGARGRVLLRARIDWRSDRGLTRVSDAPDYVYVTPNRLQDEPRERGRDQYRRSALREDVPDREQPVPVCYSGIDVAAAALDGPFSALKRARVGCFSRRTGTGRIFVDRLRRSSPRIDLRWSFPLLLTAIDPDAEARLTGLGGALVTGRYLRDDDRAHLAQPVRSPEDYPPRLLPVLAASRTFLDEQADITVERLRTVAAARWTRPFDVEGDTLAPLRYLQRQPDGRVVQRVRVSSEQAYRQLLRDLRRPDYRQDVSTIWRIGPIGYEGTRGALTPRTQPVDDQVWQTNPSGAGLGWAYTPPSARATRFRKITRLQAVVTPLTKPQDATPLLQAVGVFDPERLQRAEEPGTPPLTTLRPPALTPRTSRAATALGGRSLEPSGNLGGYSAQPPALLTTLQAARAFGGDLFPDLDSDRQISAVRVRVAQVTGIDAVSRERIRQVAERIATATGLDVDVTAGASGGPAALELPASRFGRPRLALTETWIRKGVATRVLEAVDRKSLMLFALILIVCALFVSNAAVAAVHARRQELGVLACVGWSTGRLFTVVLAELGAIGLTAGILGAALALPAAAVAGVDVSPQRAALAVPAATLLALLAGLLPAARAAASRPLAATRPVVLDAQRAWQPKNMGQRALVNLIRTPGRTLLAALSIAVGVCALAVLLATTIGFHNALVGSVLGDAVALRVTGTDFVAVLITVLIGVGAVADVLFLNLRERAREFATLSAVGWDDRTLSRLIALEGLFIGALGATTGAILGLACAAAFAQTITLSLCLITVAAAVTGTLLASAGAIVPAVSLRRMPFVALLAGE
jgi:putative ABC transport system permease protein